MESRDRFADIAFAQHPLDADDLAEVAPLKINKGNFTPAQDGSGRITDLPYEKKLEKFQEDLQALREKYRPFMADYLPPKPIGRSNFEVKRFSFRYETDEDRRDFVRVLDGRGSWAQTEVPDYRGPAGEQGRWTGYYRTGFSYPAGKLKNGKSVYLVFKGVDYIANVYLNRKFIGSHEGFFAPFEFEITDALREENELLVEVKNDYSILGVDGTPLDGDKIYAATGPGWDDPKTGWHHCPAGAGIYNKVFVEERSEFFIDDIFARPDIDHGAVELRVGITNVRGQVARNFSLKLELLPKNFRASPAAAVCFKIEYVGPGKNEYRYRVDFPDFRLWEPDSPWLYAVRAEIVRDGEILDCRDRTFGMRKFHMDESADPKGTLYLNNRRILLRGANEMGHLQQCVMHGDFKQLTDDILIAKLANLNFYRVTQRPVQEEIYDYFDMLGMMHQCDFPLFGFLRRNQFSEAVRQVGEMERLIKSHPSTIMVSLINEPFRLAYKPGDEPKFKKRFLEKGHRHLFRDELEAFFAAARKAIYVENPDQVVKNVEGDYDPPTLEGLSDFHCYNMWYTNHALPFGKLYKGYLPPIRRGWKTGCGEYGAEGLDNYDVMKKCYPREWLPQTDESLWMPDKIVRAQTYGAHGDWFEEQRDIRSWIKYSQRHQAMAVSLMTEAFRRRSDRIVSTAVHLLIDAWPSGWMKALVGVDRVPKPAYFALQDSLQPLKVNIRCDRRAAYEGDHIKAEIWLLNDTPDDSRGCVATVTLRSGTKDVQSYESPCEIGKTSSACVGTVDFKIPAVHGRTPLYLDAELKSHDGRALSACRFAITAYERPFAALNGLKAGYLGAQAQNMLGMLGISPEPFDETDLPEVLAVSSEKLYDENRRAIQSVAEKGGRVVLIRDTGGGLSGKAGKQAFSIKPKNGVFYAAVNRQSDIMADFEETDFSYWYNAQTDRIDFTADATVVCEGVEPLVYTYGGSASGGPDGKKKLPIAGFLPCGAGGIFLLAFPLEGRVSYNPALDGFLIHILTLDKGNRQPKR